MQGSSAQLCQDVCGAFDGLPLHGSPVSDPVEGAQSQHSLHLDDLQELGLLSNDASADYPLHRANTGQQQQQRDSPQLEVQHGCGTSSCEHHTNERQGTKGMTGCNPAHHNAAMDANTVTQAAPHCSGLQAAVQRRQHQSELLSVPDRSTQRAAAARDKHASSHGSLSRQLLQPVMHKEGASIASEELLKAAGEQSSWYMQMHSAHSPITVSAVLQLIIDMLATCHLPPFACWERLALPRAVITKVTKFCQACACFILLGYVKASSQAGFVQQTCCHRTEHVQVMLHSPTS